ncbi:hypothetical protein Z968_10955 [Clostridium novyi A str. 4552]|uniref:ABC transporter permease n=1 Tax=Clostridium novyi A str. 4552 TaxID=1444289 RepID=A0A0A0I1Y9_CLONO|nr:ABC transporter permease [Clostridium novyi]KGM94782.1 hypothetical protein Z968_10955 [Clostridium novyi A str. 4552]
MYNAIYCEFLKLKKSPIGIVLILGGMVEPALMVFGQLYRGDIVEWNKYMNQIECITFLIVGGILFTLVSSYIYVREFMEKVSSVTYSYSISNTKIFFAKLITVFICIAYVYVLQFIASILLGCLLDHEPLYKETLIIHTKIYMYSLFFQCAIVPLSILIASISEGVIMPITYSVIGTFISLVIMSSKKYGVYFPFTYPVLPIMSIGVENSVVILSKYVFIVSIMFFIVTVLSCIIYYEKHDIS